MLCNTRFMGRRGECRNPMHEVIDSLGRVTWTCHRCEWNKIGLCWECGNKKEEKKLYCLSCGKNKQRAAIKQHNKSPEAKKKSAEYFKNRWHKDAEFRKRKLELKREWLAKNPHKKKQYKVSSIYKELSKT